MRFIDRIKKRLVGPKPNNPQFEHKTGEDAVRALLQAHPQQSAPVPPIEKRIAATVKSPTIPGEIPKRPSPHSPETIIANIDRGVAKLFSNPMERENVQVDHNTLLENCPRLLLDKLTNPDPNLKLHLITPHMIAVNFSKGEGAGGRAYFVDANSFPLKIFEDILRNNKFVKKDRSGKEMFFYKKSSDYTGEVRIYFVPNLLELIGHEQYRGSIHRLPQ
ncbi:MAG TPA: hypothetical protein VFF13_01100 [archaeon]|nr:hypothetical protein [archaeon]